MQPGLRSKRSGTDVNTLNIVQVASPCQVIIFFYYARLPQVLHYEVVKAFESEDLYDLYELKLF